MFTILKVPGALAALSVVAFFRPLPTLAEVRVTCDAAGAQVVPSPRVKPQKGTGPGGAVNFRRLDGLAPYLRASGSSEFPEQALIKLLTDPALLGGQQAVTFVDLRKEWHGFVRLDSPTPAGPRPAIAVSWRGAGDDEQGLLGSHNWLNAGLSADQIVPGETQALADLRGPFPLYEDGKCQEVLTAETQVTPRSAMSEAALLGDVAARLGRKLGYQRFPVMDHGPPDDDALIDRYVELVARASRDGTWLHLHCRMGMGRTTTFLALYDMIHSAQEPGMTAERILLRQGKQKAGGVGGQDLLVRPGHKDGPMVRPAEMRERFLRDFFAYASDPKNLVVERTSHRITVQVPFSRWAGEGQRLRPITRAQALAWAQVGTQKDDD